MFALSGPRQRVAVVTLIAFHIFIVIASNFLVQFPMQLFGWQTTWGAFSFPFIFLATDLTVRLLGKQPARRVIAYVMLPALLVSYVVSVLFQEGIFRGVAALLVFNSFILRISLASFTAYAIGQLADIQVFDRLRQLKQWWIAPTVSTVLGNMLDTFVFFSIAFWYSSNAFMAEHWIEIAVVDYIIKILISLLLFIPLYGLLLNLLLRFMGAPAEAKPAAH
jgi:uncharacterized integral membrane protein (TIGR00697 family)